jgi:hypothetical protein
MNSQRERETLIQSLTEFFVAQAPRAEAQNVPALRRVPRTLRSEILD